MGWRGSTGSSPSSLWSVQSDGCGIETSSLSLCETSVSSCANWVGGFEGSCCVTQPMSSLWAVVVVVVSGALLEHVRCPSSLALWCHLRISCAVLFWPSAADAPSRHEFAVHADSPLGGSLRQCC